MTNISLCRVYMNLYKPLYLSLQGIHESLQAPISLFTGCIWISTSPYISVQGIYESLQAPISLFAGYIWISTSPYISLCRVYLKEVTWTDLYSHIIYKNEHKFTFFFKCSFLHITYIFYFVLYMGVFNLIPLLCHCWTLYFYTYTILL